jgi:hypothetical protein
MRKTEPFSSTATEFVCKLRMEDEDRLIQHSASFQSQPVIYTTYSQALLSHSPPPIGLEFSRENLWHNTEKSLLSIRALIAADQDFSNLLKRMPLSSSTSCGMQCLS